MAEVAELEEAYEARMAKLVVSPMPGIRSETSKAAASKAAKMRHYPCPAG